MYPRKAQRLREIPVLIACALAMLVMSPMVQVEAAQEASPPDSAAPNPALCRIEPRPLAFYEVLAASPVATGASTPAVAASPTPFVVPAGEPADAVTVATVTETFVEQVACFNAGDQLRVFAFLTEEYVARLAATGALPGIVQLLQTPPAPLAEEDYARDLDVRDVVILPDGRVGAIVQATFPTESPEPSFAYAVFVPVGDRFLYDDFVDVDDYVEVIDPGATPKAAA